MNDWIKYPLQTAIALIGSMMMATPTWSQASSPALSVDRAMFLIQSEAAAQLNTYTGNIELPDFDSNWDGPTIIGYTATVKPKEGEVALICSVDLDENVLCSSNGIPELNQCGPERRQETIMERQFTHNQFSQLNDYAVRVYYNIDDLADTRYLCMNVYDTRNNLFVGAIPAKESPNPNITAYYSNEPLHGIDYQILLNPDNTYVFRRSEGANLLYEGYSY